VREKEFKKKEEMIKPVFIMFFITKKPAFVINPM